MGEGDRKTERKSGKEMERGHESNRESEKRRKERSRARACCSVMLLLKCRASRPLVVAIKRKK